MRFNVGEGLDDDEDGFGGDDAEAMDDDETLDV
jgi:hypothetical protein